MANSSDSVTSDESFAPAIHTANEVAELLHLGQDFASYLEKQPYSEDDPIVVFDFLNLKEEQKLLIFNVLTSMRNIGGKMTVFATLVGTYGNVFKFATLDLYNLARRELLCNYSWLFFYPSDFNGPKTQFSAVPTVTSVVITFYSEKKFEVHDWQFFELA
ncbi:hypothetical protein Mgra_00000431 [Meloidogyne graminicola]|uniref:Uncharacterized protein n=1 Tax=Meloidogyne graminicola TaxID=189291 RepID=A0A8T0A3K6_9BILA|nr:hypothetical protein Mgra_00000431 [Meloidogyne graminicola]